MVRFTSICKPSFPFVTSLTYLSHSNPQISLYTALQGAGVTFISVGHRNSLRRFHTHILQFREPNRGSDTCTWTVQRLAESDSPSRRWSWDASLCQKSYCILSRVATFLLCGKGNFWIKCALMDGNCTLYITIGRSQCLPLFCPVGLSMSFNWFSPANLWCWWSCCNVRGLFWSIIFYFVTPRWG